jgi:nucleoside-diphosphate-sugar epimerase
LANVYGPSLKFSRVDDRGILTKVTKNRLAGNNIQVFGNGNYVRDYVYIDDVVSALLHTSIISDADDTYNVGSGIGSTIKDVFNLISSEVKNCTGVSANVENVTWPKNYNKIDKRNYIASIEQLKTASDWSPKIFLEEGIQRLVRYYSIGKIND